MLHKYMLNNNETTVQLNDNQQQAIEETKARLSNLENEISIAQKNLKSIKLDSERAIKDKAYQEELLAEVVAKVSSARSQLAEVEPQVVEKTAQLNNLLEYIREETVSHETKKKDLEEREKYVFEEEENLKRHSNLVMALTKEREKEEDIFDNKVAKLKEVLKEF